ncbi:MAG: molybdopterin molybdotransferase MoeA [Bacteroidia bacterium]|nr:molybdopterin molybdotransferase MoeA [Bacteroidia bacterium]
MIAIEDAKQLIAEHVPVLQSALAPLNELVGHVLSESIISPVNLPPFDQSAMDGYAICHDGDLNTFEVEGEVPAGEHSKTILHPGKAMRIFTGAKVPTGTTTVVMQEHVSAHNNTITINKMPATGANIRRSGSHIKQSEIALNAGTVLTPGAIGFISAMGIDSVKAYKFPSVSIIVTGSELQPAGQQLADGKIYESNSATLASALKQIGINTINYFFAKDDKSAINAALSQAEQQSDLVLISGGISVGNYDFVKECLLLNDVEVVFHKIKQKPGKPLLFGTKNLICYFALPGNPAAVLTCFYEYVYPAIRKMCGYRNIFMEKRLLAMAVPFTKKTGLGFFLKSYYDGAKVTPLEGQESYVLKSFAFANSLIYLKEEDEKIEQGTIVETHILPLS